MSNERSLMNTNIGPPLALFNIRSSLFDILRFCNMP